MSTDLFGKQLFDDLVTLVAANDGFHCAKSVSDGHHYWIFDYRLASYTDFLWPNALNCRGVMFEVTEAGEYVRVACLPFAKFFNQGEVSSDLNTLAQALIKLGRLSEDVYIRAKNQHSASPSEESLS